MNKPTIRMKRSVTPRGVQILPKDTVDFLPRVGILSQAMSRNDETGRFDPGTRVTIDKVFNRLAHGKSGTVIKWNEDLKVYVVQIDGWKQEMTFQASELVKED